MIVTLTPNPSLDLLFTADRLVWEDANRIPMPRRRPGGQGINLARAVRVLAPDATVLAVAPLGGPTGDELRGMLVAEGTPLAPVPIPGETRVFVGVRESGTGRSLLLNPRGPEVTNAEADALLAAVRDALDGTGGDRATWLVASGSLLPGLPADFYARAGRLARDLGVRFVPDGDGDALEAAVPEADLLAPNAQEAGRLVGADVATRRDALGAARTLLDRSADPGAARVVVTLGREGAVGVDAAGGWWARPEPPAEAVTALAGASAVGAGDAFLAALLLALDDDAPLPDALASAVAAGTAVLHSSGSDLLTRADAVAVREWVEVGSATGG